MYSGHNWFGEEAKAAESPSPANGGSAPKESAAGQEYVKTTGPDERTTQDKELSKMFTRAHKPGPDKPIVELEKAKKRYEQGKAYVDTLGEQLKQLRRKIKTGSLYIQMLDLFSSLDPSDQKSIRDLLQTKKEVVSKLQLFHQLKEDTATVTQANKMLDVDLVFWGNISALKEQGVLDKDSVLASLRPANKDFTYSVDRSPKPAPNVKGSGEASEVYTLGPKGIAHKLSEIKDLKAKQKKAEAEAKAAMAAAKDQQMQEMAAAKQKMDEIAAAKGGSSAKELGWFGEEDKTLTQEQIEAEAKALEAQQAEEMKKVAMETFMAEKNLIIRARASGVSTKQAKTFFRNFKKSLPGPLAWLARLKEAQRPAAIRRETQSYVVKWGGVNNHIISLKSDLDILANDYRTMQQHIKERISKILSMHEGNQLVVDALGVVVNTKPERFVTAATLKQGLISALSADSVSNLGAVSRKKKDPTLEAVNALLKKQMELSESALKEAAIKGVTLDTLKDQVAGKVSQSATLGEGAAGGLLDNKLLSLALLGAGAFVISRFMGGK